MNQIIKPTAINYTELLKNSTTTLQLSETTQSKLIDLLNEQFTEQQQHLYVTNLWMYMNYHPTNDFPINLETVFHMIGFANKGNAKRTLENNFTKDEDYKIILLPREKKQNAGRCEEEIMLNTDTFKSMCMIAKTPQGKEMRKYYVKLENINHHLITEELKEQKLLLIEQTEVYTKEKEQIWKNSFRNKYVVYLICISENLIKYGYTKDFDGRLTSHKTDYGKNIQIAFIIESKNNEMLETLFENHEKIKPNRISQKFKGDNKTELIKLDKNLSLKNVINILTDTNKVIDIMIETQLFKKHNIDILNYTHVQNNIEPIKKKYIKKKKQNVQEIENDNIIKEYIDTMTIKSTIDNDTIKMNDLYNKFCEWIKVKYPNNNILPQNKFTRRMNTLKIVDYKDSISNLNNTSGIINRKFKN